MTNPSNSAVQNLLPVQAYFNLDGSFNTFIGQGVPFYASANPVQSGLTITNSTINSSVIGGTVPAAGTFTSFATTTGTISTNASSANDIVNFLTLQSYAAGISWKNPVTAATLTNITLSGTQTVDGVALVAGNTILVKNQTDNTKNGIYQVNAGAWTYATGSTTWSQYVSAVVFIEYGTQNGTAWYCTALPGGTLGTTAMTWSNFTVSSSYSAGTGLTLAAGVFSITNTGVAASTYGSATASPVFAVNAQGQITSVTNTTITPALGSITGFGTGVATFLATPTSANLAAAVTDETGTGALVFATSPTFVTPALGTPASGVVTNLTGTASISINGSVGATTPNTGAFTYLSTSSVTSTTPTLTFNGSNSPLAIGATISGSYLQVLMQNKSGTAGASTNFVLSNDLGTDSSYYGEFGMNSSVFSASTPADFFSINNGVYFSAHDGDVSVGSGNGGKHYLVWGTTGQSAHVINVSGAIGLNTNLGTTPATSGTTNFGTAGYIMTSGGSSASPSWTNPTSIVGGAGGSTTQVQYNLSGLLTGSANMTFDGTTLTTAGLSDSGNLTFTGTGNRIRGDFSNATDANRVAMQTSTVNAGTRINIISNGTGTASSLDVFGLSDPTNTAVMRIRQSGVESQIQASITGTGTYLPLTMYTGGSERLRIDTNGLVGIGLTPSGTTVQLQVSSDALISGLTVGKGGGAVASNTSLGNAALSSNSTGANNVALGNAALNANTASNNTAVGSSALRLNTSGDSNSALGGNALYNNTTGNNNSAFGTSSLQNNTTASNNTAVGYQAAYSNTTGTGITAVGYKAAYAASTTTSITAIGYLAAQNVTGGDVVAIGYASNPAANSTGANNVSVGDYSLYSNTSGNGNNAFGSASLQNNTTGASNVAIGNQALQANTTASNNTAVGYQAGYSNTVYSYHTYVGYQAGYSNVNGVYNTFIGYQAGYNSNASAPNVNAVNTFVGYYAGQGNTTGVYNTFIGPACGYNVTTGNKNTIIGGYNGNQGGLDIRTSSNYIVLSDGDGNPRGIFTNNGYLCLGGATSTGFNETLRINTAGQQGIHINDTTSASSINYQYFTKGAGLTNVGAIYYNGTVMAYQSTSDYRLKENVAPISNALEKIGLLKPVTYTWKDNQRSGEGFLAHELQEHFPDAVSGTKDEVDEDGKPKYQGMDASFLIGTMVKAIQELKAEVDALKQQLNGA